MGSRRIVRDPGGKRQKATLTLDMLLVSDFGGGGGWGARCLLDTAFSSQISDYVIHKAMHILPPVKVRMNSDYEF